MIRAWKIKENGHCTESEQLARELSVHPVISTLLCQRGIKTFDQARTFFRPTLDNLYDPFLMNDMEQAVERM